LKRNYIWGYENKSNSFGGTTFKRNYIWGYGNKRNSFGGNKLKRNYIWGYENKSNSFGGTTLKRNYIWGYGNKKIGYQRCRGPAWMLCTVDTDCDQGSTKSPQNDMTPLRRKSDVLTPIEPDACRINESCTLSCGKRSAFLSQRAARPAVPEAISPLNQLWLPRQCKAIGYRGYRQRAHCSSR
jgi:hypothetical protein